MTLNREVILFVLNGMPYGKEVFVESGLLSGEYFSKNFIIRESEFYEFHVTITGGYSEKSYSNLTLSDVVEIISKGV